MTRSELEDDQFFLIDATSILDVHSSEMEDNALERMTATQVGD
jgi:hypothetical protein